MTISIGDYTFDGPHQNTSPISNNSGVYVILCFYDNKYHVIDIGESATVKDRLDTHDRKECWDKNCRGIIHYAVLYTPNKQQPGRMEIEQALRKKYKPVCGKR